MSYFFKNRKSYVLNKATRFFLKANGPCPQPIQNVYVSQAKLIRENISTMNPNPINRIVNLGQSLKNNVVPLWSHMI